VTLAADPSEREELLVLNAVQDFEQGRTYVNDKNYKKAIHAFNQAETKGLKLYELFAFRGLAYHELKQFQNAKRDAEKAIELQPTRMLGYELLAGVHYAMGHAEETINVVTNGLAKVEGIEKAKLHRERGILLMMLGRIEDSIKDFTRAEELGETSELLYYNRGRAHSELGRYELALQDFSKALSIAPEYDKALRARGWVYDCVGELEKSLADLNQLLDKSPQDLFTRRLRGWVRLRIGDKEGALADLRYALEAGSRDPWTFLNAAAAYSRHENMVKALEVNGQGLALKDPDSEYVFQFQRGLFLLLSGHGKEAEKFYKKAATLAFKRQDPLQLQEAIGDLKQEIQSRPQLASLADQILKELESTLATTKAPHKPRPNQCQRLIKRDE
jgi:tetratricopeptide (TPR) repeat protein